MIQMAVVGVFVMSAPLVAQQRPARECEFEAVRQATVSASARDRLELIARAGSLVVDGSGGNEVRVRGRACASSRALLDQLVVESSRSGGRVRIEVAELDDNAFDWGRNQYATLDLEVTVPAGMAASIEDGSGSMELRGLGALIVNDGSGSILLERIRGRVEIEDGSGEIEIVDVEGDVVVEDGSGEISVRGVTGSVTVDDGSGSIDVADVGGSVVVSSDGSGGVNVAEVEGDLRVAEKGSGTVRYRSVAGNVDVPEDGRRRVRRRR